MAYLHVSWLVTSPPAVIPPPPPPTGWHWQVSILKSQVEVYEKEFVRLEAHSTARVAELLGALLESKRSKVKAYEDLEHHLDDAIVRTGVMADAGGGRRGSITGGYGR